MILFLHSRISYIWVIWNSLIKWSRDFLEPDWTSDEVALYIEATFDEGQYSVIFCEKSFSWKLNIYVNWFLSHDNFIDPRAPEV